MNTIVIFRDAAGVRGRKSLPRTRAHAGLRWAARLWLILTVLAGSIGLSASALADDDYTDADPPKPRARAAKQRYKDAQLPARQAAPADDDSAGADPAIPRARAAKQRYKDSQPPVRQVAVGDDDVPLPTAPAKQGAVDSPSSVPAARKKADALTDTLPSEEARPARKSPPPPKHPAVIEDENTPIGRNPFANEEDEDNFGCSGPNLRGLLSNRLWFRGEALLWWLRGSGTPPLLTTSPGSTPQAQAGVLGQPGTTILFGDQELNTGLHGGARMSFGLWLDNNDDSGLEFSYFLMGENVDSFNASSTGIPILARPFFNVTSGSQDSHLVAYPNAFGGTFNATSTENLQGAEALWRRGIVHTCEGRFDMLLGYRYQVLTDGLELADSVTSSGTGAVPPAGTTVSAMDSFHTHNTFNGGELGFATQWHRNRWSLDTSLKVGIGETHSLVLVDGFTTVTTNGVTNGATGGLLALPSNIGPHDSNQFSVMPEIAFTVGYDITPRLKASLGYSLLYWSNVARPGDQIDTNVDTAQFPPPTTTAGVKPAFVLHTSDFWAQGLNLGLDYRF